MTMYWYYVLEFVAALVLAALELSWAPWLKLGGAVSPSLVVAAVVLVALFRGPLEGAWMGLAGALCMGALGDWPLGGLFVAYMGCGVILGVLGQTIFSNRLPLLMLTVLFTVVVAELVSLVFTPPPTFAGWLYALLLRAAYTALMTIPLAWLARWALPHRSAALPLDGHRGAFL